MSPHAAAAAHTAAITTQAAHKIRQAAKSALRADPAARAAALEALNAPILHRRRLTSIHSLSLDIAAQKDISPNEATHEAVQTLAQIEGNIAYRAAVKKQRAAKVFPADGTAAHAASRYQAAVAVELEVAA